MSDTTHRATVLFSNPFSLIAQNIPRVLYGRPNIFFEEKGRTQDRSEILVATPEDQIRTETWEMPLSIQFHSEGDRNTFTFKISFPGQGTGESRNELSALVRPFRRTIREGAPAGTMTYLFSRFIGQRPRVLGLLCHTPGHQLVFFPGLLGRRVPWHTVGGRKKYLFTGADEYLDHLTVDRQLTKWHATIVNSQNFKRLRLPTGKVREFAKGIRFCFEMHLKDMARLEPVPETLTVQVSSTSNSFVRRLSEAYIQAHQNSIHHMIEFPLLAQKAEGFLNYEFIVDQTGEEPNWRQVIGITRLEPPAVEEPLAISTPVPMRGSPIDIPGFDGRVWIISYILPGHLREEAVFSEPPEKFRPLV